MSIEEQDLFFNEFNSKSLAEEAYFGIDFKGSRNNKKPYIDFGIKKSFGPIEIIIPLYQNWDDKPFVHDKDWLLDRIRMKLDISSFNIGDLF